MSGFSGIIVNSSTPPTVEIDPSCHSVYLRFKSSKIHKTVSDNRPNHAVIAVDLDSKGEVVGVEMLGIREFSIAAIRRVLPANFRNIDFDRARFMPAPMACAN